MIADYRAQGQPMSITEFHLDPIPDEENAALLLQQSAAAIVIPDDAPIDLKALCDDPAAHPEFAAKLIELNPEPLRLVREARNRPRFFWNVPVPQFMINVTLPDLGSQKNMARLLCVAAAVETESGNSSAAAAHLYDALFIAEGVSRIWPCVITHLVRISIEDLAIEKLELLLPRWKIVAADDPKAIAIHDSIASISRRLRDEESLSQSWDFALQGERLTLIEVGLVVAKNKPAPAGVLFSPALRLDVINLAAQTDRVWHAGRQDNWFEALPHIPVYPDQITAYQVLIHYTSQQLLMDMKNATALHYKALLLHRFAATALALRLYECDHKAPATDLEDLVPLYLPAVPRDPFSATNEPIHYLRTVDREILYSVGPDGIDEGGLRLDDDLLPNLDDSGDILFYLDGNRPPLSSTEGNFSTQGIKNDVNQ